MSQDDKVYYVPKDSPVYPNKFDTRVRLRSLTLGLLKYDEIKAHEDQLPDESANAEFRDFNTVIEEDEAVSTSDDESI
jgi:hypothetical protein